MRQLETVIIPRPVSETGPRFHSPLYGMALQWQRHRTGCCSNHVCAQTYIAFILRYSVHSSNIPASCDLIIVTSTLTELGLGYDLFVCHPPVVASRFHAPCLPTSWKHLGGGDVQPHPSFISALDGGKWSAWRSNQLYSGDKPPVPIEQEGGRFGEEADLLYRIFEPVTIPSAPPRFLYIFGIPGKCSYRHAWMCVSIARRASRFMWPRCTLRTKF